MVVPAVNPKSVFAVPAPITKSSALPFGGEYVSTSASLPSLSATIPAILAPLILATTSSMSLVSPPSWSTISTVVPLIITCV